jgi:hypothetical protein
MEIRSCLANIYEEIERDLIRFGGPEEAKWNCDSWNFLQSTLVIAPG